MYNTAPKTNTILHLGKSAPTISILKPNKNHNIGTSYRSILLLSAIAKALEKGAITINNRKHSIKDNKHALNTMPHSRNSNRSTSGVSQGGIWSSTLLKIYITKITLPQNHIQISAYADDITITASHTNHYLRPNNSFNNIFAKSQPTMLCRAC